jgi:hypothetical protein
MESLTEDYMLSPTHISSWTISQEDYEISSLCLNTNALETPGPKKRGLDLILFLFNFSKLKYIDGTPNPMAQPLLIGKAEADIDERHPS